MLGSGRVPRWARIANGLSLLLLVAGAGVYGRAWVGMQRLKSHDGTPDAPLLSGLARFNHFHELSQLGLGLVGAGVAVAVLTAILAAVRQRRA